jgi:hypothetical protein
VIKALSMAPLRWRPESSAGSTAIAGRFDPRGGADPCAGDVFLYLSFDATSFTRWWRLLAHVTYVVLFVRKPAATPRPRPAS